MKPESLADNLSIIDRDTYLYASFSKEGVNIEFAYCGDGLRFKSKGYGGYVKAFHVFDSELFTDLDSKLEPMLNTKEKRNTAARAVETVLAAEWEKLRCREGQSVTVFLTETTTAGTISHRYLGFIRSIEDGIVMVKYDGGRQMTASPVRVGNETVWRGLRGGSITLGQHVELNINGTLIA